METASLEDVRLETARDCTRLHERRLDLEYYTSRDATCGYSTYGYIAPVVETTGWDYSSGDYSVIETASLEDVRLETAHVETAREKIEWRPHKLIAS